MAAAEVLPGLVAVLVSPVLLRVAALPRLAVAEARLIGTRFSMVVVLALTKPEVRVDRMVVVQAGLPLVLKG